MATRADVRRIALALPGAQESESDFAFFVQNKGKPKGFVWSWKERIHPKKARIPHPTIIAVRVPNLVHKETLLASEPRKFFTEPHYNGYPAVLVRIEAVTVADLKVLIADAWECQAPKELLESTAFDKP